MAQKSAYSSKKGIVPITNATFNDENISFGNIHINHERNLRSVPIKYSMNSSDKLVVRIKGSRIISAKPPNEKSSSNSLYISIEDKDAIELFNKIEDIVKITANERKVEWFGNDQFDMDDINSNFRPSITENTKYKSFNMNVNLSKYVRIVNMGTPTNEEPMAVLQQNQIIDMCIEIDRVKPALQSLKLGYIVTYIQITGMSDAIQSSTVFFPFDFEEDKFKVGELQTNESGGKFARINYDDSSPTFALDNISARIFHNQNEYEDPKTKEKKFKDVYSLSIRLTNDEYVSLYKRLDKALFTGFKTGHMAYLSRPKSSKPFKDSVLETLYSSILYNKEDREKIRQKEEPKNPPTLRISIYWNEETKFGNKFIDDEGKLVNVDELINKPINIKHIEFYIKHMWFGKDNTTTKFNLSKCIVEDMTPEYIMDDISTSTSVLQPIVNTQKVNSKAKVVSDSDEDPDN
jgi:hypothetical protein